MLIKLTESANLPFSTRDPTTGEAVDADSLPTAAVYEEGALTPLAYVPTVASLTAKGQYNVPVAVTAANGFEVGKSYVVRVAATVTLVSDETQIGLLQVSVENHGVAIDVPISSRAAWDDVPDARGGGKTAWEIICIAAAGAGAGVVDTGVPPGATRNEAFSYLDGTPAFTTTADQEGNRTVVNLNP